jgi:hypothetical protein
MELRQIESDQLDVVHVGRAKVETSGGGDILARRRRPMATVLMKNPLQHIDPRGSRRIFQARHAMIPDQILCNSGARYEAFAS